MYGSSPTTTRFASSPIRVRRAERGERRHHRRYGVRRVEGSLHAAVALELVDISLTGMAVQSTSPLKIGGTVPITVRHGDARIPLRPRVRWSKLISIERRGIGDPVSVYRAGLEFGASLGDDARPLLGYIASHIVVDVGRRVRGRFRSTPDAGGATFEVERLSMHGILIRTSTPLDAGAIGEADLDGSHPLRGLTGRVTHVDAAEPNAATHRIGLELITIPPLALQPLRELIASHIE